MRDKFGGAVLAILGILVSVFTVVDSLDGSFSYASKMNGVYEVVYSNGATDFFFSLGVQVFIGLAVCGLGLGIYFKPKF